jgi:hypothetical protein
MRVTTLYAVRLSDGSFMGPRKHYGETKPFLVFTEPAEAGNEVIERKRAGKMDVNEVVFLHSFRVLGGEVKFSGFGMTEETNPG